MIDHISIVIITKNAEQTLSQTLQSLKTFKEVVIYDNGSTDLTLEIAKSFSNVTLYEGDFLGFGLTKNHAVSLASNNWVLSLDADESLSDEMIEHVATITLGPKLVGEIQRDNYFLGKKMKVAGWGSDYIVRLFNRTEFSFSDRKVHEKVEINDSADIVRLKGIILHDALNKLSQTLDKANLYSELYSEQQEITYSPWVILLKSSYSFFRTYILQRGFMAGWRGLTLAFANAVGVFYKYMKVYARQQQEKGK